MPIGFLGCWLGTMLSSEARREGTYDELLVRSELGLGSERREAPRSRRGGARGETHGEAARRGRPSTSLYAAVIWWLPRKSSSGSTSALTRRRRA